MKAKVKTPFHYWPHHLAVAKNNFVNKSLSCWSCNTAVGCAHGCLFCYVPETSTKKQAQPLQSYGIKDPDAEWGDYSLLRSWDGDKFRSSLGTAAKQQLNPDGNRAVMYSTTTDPYQVFNKSHPADYLTLNRHHEFLMRKSLEMIRDESDFNVRILTRSGAAARHFELFQSFGNRLVFGMSLPTLNDKLRETYEPDAPGVEQRLKTLQKAKEAGLHVYVAIAPTYPECDGKDLRATLEAVKAIEPITIFHEPINMRAQNVARIVAHAKEKGLGFKSETFKTDNSWSAYAIRQLMQVQRIATDLGIQDRLHLWPDPQLMFDAKGAKAKTSKKGFQTRLAEEWEVPTGEIEAVYDRYIAWVQGWWSRISEWPGATHPAWTLPEIPSECFLK